MSKISRNIKSFPVELLRNLEENKNENNSESKLNDYFGDEVQGYAELSTSGECPIKPLSTISSGSDLGSALYLDIDKLSGLSSTSSTSWSEEYESGVTKKALFEMEKLDKILQGINEPCSLGYSREELEDWRKMFGNISILGRVTPSNSTESSDVEFETNHNTAVYSKIANNNKRPSILDLNLKRQQILINKDCDISNNNLKISRTQLPDTDHIGEIKLPRTGTGRSKRRLENQKIKNKSVFTFSNKPKSLDIEKYLKISSLKSPRLNERKMSSKSLIHQKVTNDTIQHSEEFSSLPFLTDFTRRCNLSTKSIRKRSIAHEHKKTSDNNLILPPINLNYRSVSATPRASSKVLSALSVKFADLHSKHTSHVIDHLEDIPLSNR